MVVDYRQVIIALEGDEAGRRSSNEIAGRFARCVWVRVVEVPKSKQPDGLSRLELQTLLDLS